MVNFFAPARGQSALYSRPWMGQTGTYPGASNNNALSQMFAPPAAPAAPQMPQQQAPMYAGSVPMTGFQGDGADVGQQPSVEHPNQTVGNMLGSLATAVSFGISPATAMAGMFAGMLNDDVAGRQIGSTTGFLDVGMRAAGLPSIGEIIGGMFDGGGASFTGNPNDTSVSQGFTDALLGAPVMGAGLIGGFGDGGAMGGIGGAPSGPGDLGGGFGGPGGHGGPENY